MSETGRKEFFFREWVAALLVAATLAMIGRFTDWFGVAWRQILWVWDWLWEPVALARAWQLVLWGYLALTLLVAVGRLLSRAVAAPAFHAYREDEFLGLVWRWRWQDEGRLSDPWCFCPGCDRAMVFTEHGSAYNPPHVTAFACERC